VNSDELIVFVKAPRHGQVKTRLAAGIGAQAACDAYRRLVGAVLKNVETVKGVHLRFAPDDARDEIAPWLRPGWLATAQGGGDLGERLSRAFEDAFARGAGRVAIIGSDCPDASAADVRAAFRELREHDVVVGPATDGGYWLIALRAPQPALFHGIPWSSDQVLAQTLQAAKALRLRIQLLRILTDVDTEEEWRQCAVRLRGDS